MTFIRKLAAVIDAIPDLLPIFGALIARSITPRHEVFLAADGFFDHGTTAIFGTTLDGNAILRTKDHAVAQTEVDKRTIAFLAFFDVLHGIGHANAAITRTFGAGDAFARIDWIGRRFIGNTHALSRANRLRRIFAIGIRRAFGLLFCGNAHALSRANRLRRIFAIGIRRAFGFRFLIEGFARNDDFFRSILVRLFLALANALRTAFDDRQNAIAAIHIRVIRKAFGLIHVGIAVQIIVIAFVAGAHTRAKTKSHADLQKFAVHR